jgi:curved DNA-binding protein CbpA
MGNTNSSDDNNEALHESPQLTQIPQPQLPQLPQPQLQKLAQLPQLPQLPQLQKKPKITHKKINFVKNKKTNIIDKYSPYEILNVSTNASFKEIRESYKNLVKKHHPDKGGSEFLFKLIKTAYSSLEEKENKKNRIKGKINQKVVKKDYNSFVTNKKNIHVDNKNFNINIFNETFEKSQINIDPNQKGYGNIMDNTSRNAKNDSITHSNLTQFIESDSDEDIDTQVQVYKEPSALSSCNNIGYSNLGEDEINDFSLQTNILSSGYSDYKKAHRKKSNFINPEKVDYKTYNNLEDYKRERENISYNLSKEDKQLIQLKKEEDDKKEKDRQSRQSYYDEKNEQNFRQFNRLFIK